jgi:hypothetical protein
MSNLEIDGLLFIIEEIDYINPIPKRRRNRLNVISGTQIINKGEYVPLEFEITTTLDIPVDRPDYYNDAFTELESKIVNVVAPRMGSFKAELDINYEDKTPNSLKVKIHITEAPETDSHIPNEKIFTIPEDKLESEEHKLEREARKKAKESNKDVDYLMRKAEESDEEY